MKKKLTSLVLTAALGLFAGFSAKAAGDILDIRPCDENGVELSAGVADIAHPVGAGRDFYFKMRLIARNPEGPNGNRWYIKYTGIGSPDIAEYLQPMQIGIYVSGRLDYATLVSYAANGDFSTELVFKYTTKPGDFALPIVLAAKESDYATETYPSTSDSSGVYAFNPLRSFWNFVYDETSDNGDGTTTTNTVACSWRIKNPLQPPVTESDVVSTWRNNTTLSACGFYVQTIDFSDDDESADYWRSVHENSTITGGGVAPRLVADAPSTNAVSLYVWSENEDAFYVDTDNVVNMRVNSAGDVEPKHVGTVTFAGGQVTPADFAIRGAIGGEGRTANLVLSAYPQYNFNSETTQRLTDFLTAKVKCIEPMPPSVVVECDRATAVASGNYTTYAAVLNVYLSQGYENAIDVRITPEFTDGSGADWKQYLRFSTTSDTIDEPNVDGSDAALPTVRIPAESTDKQTIYVFALRADTHTLGGAKIKFQSSIVDDPAADAAITEKGSKSINVSAETTAIIAPSEGSKAVSTTCNDEYPFTIAVSDTFADTHDTATGYKIFVKYRSSDTFVQLDGAYYVGDGGALYRLDLTDPGNPVKTTDQPILKYTASGENLESQVYVVAPVNPNTGSAKKSEIRTFLADVKEARTVKVSSWDEDFTAEQRTFTEGDTAGFKITLSEKNETGETIYAYLKPSSNAEPGMFSCASYNCIIGQENPEGLPVNNSMQDIEGLVTLLDGYAKPGLKVTFEVVLSSEQNWDGTDDTKRIKGYDSNYLTITINNVEPTIKRMEMNGIKATGDGYQFNNKLPMGQTQSFTLYVDDPGTYDLTNDTHPFQVRWTAMLADGTVYDDPVTLGGNPKTTPFEYAFPAAGVWSVTAEVKDKDMDDWSEITYTVYVTVLAQPAVEHPDLDGDGEQDEEIALVERLGDNPLEYRKFSVGVGYWDPKYAGSLDVLVQVSETSPGKPNPGVLKLDAGFALSAAEAELILAALDDPEHPYDPNSDYYRVTLSQNKKKESIAYAELDGTDNASIYGFRIVSFVINGDVLPTSGAAANEYYLTSKPTKVTVINAKPTFGDMTLENTNAWKVAGGAATQYPIRWSVKEDVDRDWSTEWTDDGVTGTGIHVTFSGCDNAEAEGRFLTEPGSGKFIPNFGSRQGEQVVTVTITDKDGGSQTWTYLYVVEPSKFLKTYSTGPSGGTTTSKLSQRYARMRLRGGLGEGHTFVAGATFSSAENFELTWNCSKAANVNAFAFGYKVSDDAANPTRDDGSLDSPRDIPVNTVGNQTAELALTDYYTYAPADGKDSFFYLWILTTLDESGTPSDTVLGQTISPETGGAPGMGRVPLPNEQTEDGAYLETIVEAVYAKEWRVADNLGDINQDGVPDAYAATVWGTGQSLIQASTGMDDLEGDLVNIAASNPDEDYLPSIARALQNAQIYNRGGSSYAPFDYALDNRLEVRGFHEGLNETSIARSDVSFSEDEARAYKDYFREVNGTDWTEDDGFDLGFWSPEPRGTGEAFRMDPTVEDTDADGLPDGWEYFFWYQAKVWSRAYAEDGEIKATLGVPRAGQRYLFERFDTADILRGTEITRDEVMERFHPCVPVDTAADGYSPDFDNDGLTDLEELLIGTNPCHWDTDGDHMSDGWEVMMSLDPLFASKTGNSDGDFMAYCDLESYFGVEIVPGYVLFDVKGELRPYDELTGEGDYRFEPIGDPYYADRQTYDSLGLIVVTPDAQNEDGEDNYPLYYYVDPWGDNVLTLDDTMPGAQPYGEAVAVLVHDVTLSKALVAHAKTVVDEEGNEAPYTYGLTLAEEVVHDNPPFWHWGRPMLEQIMPDTEWSLAEGTILENLDYILIHDQVRTAFGFDPRTGWNMTARGYVANRWDPSVNRELSLFDSTGIAVNTSPYGDYDEYLVMRYRLDYGVALVGDPGIGDNIWTALANRTTMPTISLARTDIEALLNATNAAGSAMSGTAATNLYVTANIAEYLAEAFAQAGSAKTVRIGHGADTDGDGVPDGWELYVSRSPNAGPPPAEDGFGPVNRRDFDNDGLSYADEYAGTDSCNAYASCESIYSRHPGNATGWFNKFFPTNPGEMLNGVLDGYDTDGDTVLDGAEGEAWLGTFANGGATYAVGIEIAGMTFIYGDPQDSITTCVRGGGMNPCTVDTDKDGLPDAWEMQFAGIPVDATTRQYVGPAAAEVEIEIAPATFTADGLDAAGFTPPAVVYIAGGMDATWGGDACTDANEEANSYDPLLGTLRDVDFDHDGLQNSQEYLVQQVRHFRYDDATTPLMGRMPDGTFLGFVTMMQDADQFALACIDAGYPESATNAFNAATWIASGYFGAPAHDWDMMVCCLTIQPSVMLPPAGTVAFTLGAGGSYVSTDPRLADTDMDGMDDYYEMFHALNPLLGTTVPMPSPLVMPQRDVIWEAYGMLPPPFPQHAFYNAWNGWGAVEGRPMADPILYPWIMGAGEIDADGDGLRNDGERLTANLASPNEPHTDPTPLWYTDTSSPNSYVTQYYVSTFPVAALPFLSAQTPLEDDPFSVAAPLGGTAGYICAFEENEGYDTDNDWTADGREIVRTFRAPTDPLNFDDPFRRQALYLDGAGSWLQTRDPNYRGINAVDFFRQFTVEAWVRPEKTGEQTILERSCVYDYDAINKDDGAIRANFRIGLAEDGRVYGMFDNNDAIESGRKEGVSCQTVYGPELPLDDWSHVALTYDGRRLVLYVDGRERAGAATTLIPANGVTGIVQDPTYTNTFTAAVYNVTPAAFFIGGRPVAFGAGGAAAFTAATSTYAAMRDEWFQGYVDEVRVWDGARTESEIAASWKRRMSMDDAATNRLEVYTHLLSEDADASRNDNDGLKNLTAELVQLYDFSTLPGAVNASDVAKAPSGFATAVAGQLVSAPAAFSQNVGWWNACETRSTVYDDYTVVPWVENAVHHLPVMDGSVVDSFLYAQRLGGYYTLSTAHGLSQYTFANGAMPYHYYDYIGDRYQRLFALNQALAADPGNETLLDLVHRYDFEIRSDFIGTSDLLPMGGAYAKTCPAMWDGQGVADAWSQTGADADGDGLPDWWEDLYAEQGLDKDSAEDWAKLVAYPDASSGAMIPAWEAYLRDLARGMQPDGSVDDAYVATADGDGDGLLDWWQNLFAVSDAAGDADGDGLSNYVEYMLSEVFHLKDGGNKWLRFAPDNPFSVNPNVSDYFHRLGQLYVGEIFTDHDRIKDQWESDYLVRNDGVSPYAYDPDGDADGDGWSNYAEFQSGTDPTVLGSLSVDAVQMDEYPVPTIELTVAYHGNQSIGDQPVVVKAWSDQTLATIPDAVWTLGGGGSVAVAENGNSNIVTGVKYFGMNPLREVLLHLSPGSVVPGTVKFEFKDLSWVLYNEQTQQGFVTDPITALWEGMIIDQPRNDDLSTGDIVSQLDTATSLGTIDYRTGEIRIDFAAFPPEGAIVGDISTPGSGEPWLSIYNLQKSYVRVNWQSKLITGGNVTTYYLAEADRRSATNNSLGHVKEGLNTFIAFYDFDGNGMYTPGEPYGIARNVDVGWNYAKATIELTNTSVIAPRYDLTKGSAAADDTGAGAAGTGDGAAATDREQLFMKDSADVFDVPGGNVAEAKDSVRVRIARFAVDSMDIGLLSAQDMAIVYDRVLDLTPDGHPVLTEADILSMPGNEFDLDWNASALANQPEFTNLVKRLEGTKLADGKTPALFTNVFYTVYVGPGNIVAQNTTNGMALCKAIVRKFGSTRAQPVAIPGPVTINTPAPTFSWRNGDNTFTAFRVRVTGNGFSWTSDYQPMPPRDGDGVCSWTAPLRVGAIVPGGTAEFKNDATYTWSVSTYNAKYRTDHWVTGGTFYVNVLTDSTDYGTAHVAVRYYGPSAVTQSAKIRVQAFATPDFSGEPVGEGYVKSTADLASTEAITSANATIVGLKAGSYYIRAFVDTDRNGVRSFWTDAADRHFYWESWGCYCTRDVRTGTIFTPKSVTVGPKMNAGDIIPVYIDDCDTDRDSLPDAWEWAQNGNLTAYGANRIDQNANGFTMNKVLTKALTADGVISSGLSTMTTSNLQAPRVAALLLGLDATGSDAAVDATLNSAKGDATAEPFSVAITAIELDRESGTVAITADTEGTQSGSAAVVSEIYTIPSGGSLTLTCKVWHRDALDAGSWKVIQTQKVSIEKTTKTYTFDLDGNVDLASGFFKVTLEK